MQSPAQTIRTAESELLAFASTPRTLWVELTSKCPFDCIFCSRRMRRGAGEHLPFEVYTALLDQLADPRKVILNYSGESTVYPDLIPAIRAARAKEAAVELVSALATAPESMLQPLRDSGLNRLTVSLHATDPAKFAEIYRYSDVETLRARLERFVDLCRAIPKPPSVDLAFVAMDANLAEFPNVAAFADSLELRDVSVFPVMRRDEIPAQFPIELTGSVSYHREFEDRVRTVVSAAASCHPRVRFHLTNESFTGNDTALGEVPALYPAMLPPDALIHTCEQNPWETAHVLSNGDVVVCEVLDRVPMGNLLDQPLAEIWHGRAYQDFRSRYRRGQVAECRSCPWKRAYRPAPLAAEILAARGMNAQLLHGWHEPESEDHIWSSQQAAAVLKVRRGSNVLHVSGLLPPGAGGSPNELTISVNGTQVGRVANPWEQIIDFGLDFAVASDPEIWSLQFRTSHIYRPIDHGDGTDQRDLGFALVLTTAKTAIDEGLVASKRMALHPLAAFVDTVDRWGREAARRWRRPLPTPLPPWRPGVTIVIPERDNPVELAACLASVREAGRGWNEPLELIVVVNGTPAAEYGALRHAYPEVRWLFYANPLGFAGAVHAGLRAVKHDWVYLLNNDVTLDSQAVRAVAALRDPAVFSIASQIVLKDATRFREETNWTALLLENGLATVHDWIPKSPAPVPGFYSGGGASLFRTSLLRRFLSKSAYHPFYWEDVEWGWRARKLGYGSLFCPASIANHTQHATIGRLYTQEHVERVVARNRLLFHLRNLIAADTTEPALEEIARCGEVEYFLSARTRARIARGRLWNHIAPLSDEEVFARWQQALQSRA